MENEHDGKIVRDKELLFIFKIGRRLVSVEDYLHDTLLALLSAGLYS